MRKFLVILLFLLVCAEARAQRPGPVSVRRRIELSFPVVLGWPGLDESHIGEYWGTGLGASVTMTRLRYWMFDIDVRGFLGRPLSDEDEYGNIIRGKLYGVSLGAPIKVGHRVYLYLRPSLDFQSLSHARYRIYTSPSFSLSRTEYEQSLAVGFTIDVGIQIYTNDRFSLLFSFSNTVHLLEPHEGRHIYNSGFTGISGEKAWTSIFLFAGLCMRLG
ncbi:MAG: hypothetical protein ACYS47_04385 [Planctomycetota bacterium]|jgi:hypothetical protein